MLRRSRSDTLSVLRQGSRSVLDHGDWVEWEGSPELPTQRRFQVSSDGRYLALAGVKDRACRVYERGVEVAQLPGVGDSDYRFLPGGKSLAVALESGVFRLDLRPARVTSWGELDGVRPRWIEVSGEGLVVLHLVSSGYALSLLPWSGPQRLLAEAPYISHFVAAKAGSRVVYATADELFELDLRSSAAPRSLGAFRGPVTNGEMAPDGSRWAFTTLEGLFVAAGDGAPERRSADPTLHTIWFSPDGHSMAWAGDQEAHWEQDGETHVLPANGSILHTLRFIQAGVGLVVARGQEVLSWTPHAERVDVLATIPGDSLAGADLCRFGLVVWELSTSQVLY